MPAAFTWLLVAAILLVPPASIVGLILWARRLVKTRGAPRFAAWVAYGLASVGGLVIVRGLGLGVVSATSAVAAEALEPSAKARHLAEGISEIMNCGSLGLLVAGVTAGWILFWRWRTRGSSRGLTP
jgi:hypothetical protein